MQSFLTPYRDEMDIGKTPGKIEACGCQMVRTLYAMVQTIIDLKSSDRLLVWPWPFPLEQTVVVVAIVRIYTFILQAIVGKF